MGNSLVTHRQWTRIDGIGRRCVLLLVLGERLRIDVPNISFRQASTSFLNDSASSGCRSFTGIR